LCGPFATPARISPCSSPATAGARRCRHPPDKDTGLAHEWRKTSAPSAQPQASARCAGRPGARRSSLLRGESLDLLARESGQPAGRIAAWREEFLAGREGLKARPAEPTIALADAQRKVGEQAMEIDILRALLEKKGDPQSPRRSK